MKKKNTLTVDLGDRSYPIHIAPLFNDVTDLLTVISHSEVAIVTNDTVDKLYLNQLLAPIKSAGKNVISVVLPDGEQYKTLDTVNLIFSKLLENNFSRKCVLIALGGGVVGDMTGFAAASYQRGVDFIQVPTTLLSQVDSSVGGKTGVNHPLGKNMIGAFKQPLAVFIDPSSLKTLPPNEFAAGFAEVLKHGLIQSEQYLESLESNIDEILALDDDMIGQIIEQSCLIKANVVAQDETEQGIRAILNLGHTFGHAIETTVGYGQWLHGEAVAVGMLMAASLSSKMGCIREQDVLRIRTLLEAANLPVCPPAVMTPDIFMTAMSRDKKVEAGTLKLVLLDKIGQASVTSAFNPDLLKEVLEEYCRR